MLLHLVGISFLSACGPQDTTYPTLWQGPVPQKQPFLQNQEEHSQFRASIQHIMLFRPINIQGYPMSVL